jgi:hypothetical protein
MVLCGTWSETSVAPSQLTQFWQIPRPIEGFLFPVHAMFRHDCPLAVKPASRQRRPVHKKKSWRDSLQIDMLPFGVTITATVPQRSEIPEGLMNYPVLHIFKNSPDLTVFTSQREYVL